jgi:two-component system, OmpR family, sensor kinase
MSGATPDVDVLAVRIGPDGELREVLVDVHGRTDGARRLTDLLDTGSHEKAARLLADLAAGDSVVDRELVVAARGESPAAVLTWLGWSEDGDAMLVGATSAVEAMSAYADLLAINNEQSNLLRAAAAGRARERRRGESDAVQELMALNSELATAERKLAKQNVTLERVNEDKDQLLGTVAHDLRNPLAAVIGLSEALSAGRAGDLDDSARHVAERIAVVAGHMRQLVDDLVDLAAVESGRVRLDLEDAAVDALVRDAVEPSYFAAADKDIELVVRTPPDARVHADRGKVQQVVQNLVDNAVKYSHPGTTVTVDAREVDDDLVLTVTDEGQGIPAEELDGLFQPFSTTSVRSTGGERSTGLGLAIVRRLVEAHGGRVSVDSEVDVGSVFRVRLPLGGPARTDDPGGPGDPSGPGD